MKPSLDRFFEQWFYCTDLCLFESNIQFSIISMPASQSSSIYALECIALDANVFNAQRLAYDLLLGPKQNNYLDWGTARDRGCTIGMTKAITLNDSAIIDWFYRHKQTVDSGLRTLVLKNSILNVKILYRWVGLSFSPSFTQFSSALISSLFSSLHLCSVVFNSGFYWSALHSQKLHTFSLLSPNCLPYRSDIAQKLIDINDFKDW